MQGGPVLASERSEVFGQFRSATVRIIGARGTVVGAGFLVSERHLLTCAHVVAQALGIADTVPEAPAGDVQLDFPLLAPGRSLPARVVAWHPVRSGSSIPSASGDDIAVLELAADPPPESRPARLVLADDPWDHPFRAFGFPAGYDGGVWASGVLRAGQSDGWVQIEDTKQTGFFVAPGFSGGPVWDEMADGVIGMAVTADRRSDVKAAFIIPTSTLVKAWPCPRRAGHPTMPVSGLVRVP